MFNMQSALGGRVAIDSAQIGGSIVSILLRTQKLSQTGIDPNTNTYYNKQYNYLAIPVSAKLQEAYTYAAEVTRYPVESGSIVSDHIILQPIRVDLVFEVSNADGILLPQRSLEGFIKQLESRQPTTLLTQHSSLKLMVCTGIQADNQAPVWGKLNFRASFQQVQQVTLQTTAITPDMLIATNKMPPVTDQPVNTVNQSALPAANVGEKPVVSSTGATTKAIVSDMKSYQSGLNNSILGVNY
jgi:hypothetical protein